jgi:hypothetical protein
MLINSEYSIETYPGSIALNLMSAPTSIVANPNGTGTILNPLYLQYNSFIDGISTIYSNQLENGNIPVFWTIPSGDHYVPSSGSTLTSLITDGSYYFIARSNSVLPIIVPVLGSVLGGGGGDGGGGTDDFACISGDPCCANHIQVSISGDGPNFVTLSGVDNYETSLVFKISPVTARETYDYTISASGTWPVIINPSGGTVRASSNTILLNSEFYFDPTYDQDGVNICNQPDNIYSIIRVQGSGLTIDCPVFDTNFIVKCKDCLPYTSPSMAINGDYSKVNNKYVFDGINPHQVTLTGVNNNYYDLSILISGLSPEKEYSYNLFATDTNWPCYFSPQSGTISSLDDHEIIDIAFKFEKDETLSCEISNHLYAILGFDLATSGCPTLHESIKMICNGCLPSCPDVAYVSFNDGPLYTLPSGCCHKDNPFVVSVSDADPGVEYLYNFDCLSSSDVIINPASGIVSFGSNRVGKISTLINPDGQAAAIIKCSLTNTIMNTTAEDFLSIKCLVPNDGTITTTTTTGGGGGSYDSTVTVAAGDISGSGFGVTLAATPGSSISFNRKSPGSVFPVMLIYVGSVPKASITFYDSYLGDAMRIVIDGITYNTTFSSGRKDL